MPEQLISIAGAALILAAYAGNQTGILDRADISYNLMNLLGAIVLVVIAYRAGQWGFILLEGVWAALSIPPLVRGRGPSRR